MGRLVGRACRKAVMTGKRQFRPVSCLRACHIPVVSAPIIVAAVSVDLSYCVVNTNGRDYLLRCLAAIERTHPTGLSREVLVLDNASTDGSADAVRALGGDIGLIEQPRRSGKAANDSLLMERAQGRYCLLLNEDSELRA